MQQATMLLPKKHRCPGWVAAACLWAGFVAQITFHIHPAHSDDPRSCEDHLFECARDTPVSYLDFGLRKFGDDLRDSLVHKLQPSPSAFIKFDSTTHSDVSRLVYWLVNSGLDCDEASRLMINIAGRLTRTEGLISSNKATAAWRDIEASGEVKRDACRNLAWSIVPPLPADVTDASARSVCEKVRIEIHVITANEKIESVKTCALNLGDW